MILKTVIAKKRKGPGRPGKVYFFYLECGHTVRRFGCHVKRGQKGAYCTTCEAIADAKQP